MEQGKNCFSFCRFESSKLELRDFRGNDRIKIKAIVVISGAIVAIPLVILSIKDDSSSVTTTAPISLTDAPKTSTAQSSATTTSADFTTGIGKAHISVLTVSTFIYRLIALFRMSFLFYKPSTI
jgi:hypothetical protein